jgi:hypothetical protein
LRSSWGERLKGEVSGFVQEGTHVRVWDDPGFSHVWTEADGGSIQRWGLELRQEAGLSADWSQELEWRWQTARNFDAPTHVTFYPEHEGRLGLKFAKDRLEAGASLHYVSARWVRQAADEQTPPSLSLDAKLEWHLSQGFTIFTEGLNLLAQDVEEWEGFREPGPYVGLGATLSF